MKRWLVYCLIANFLWAFWSIIPKVKTAAMSDEVMQILSTVGLLAGSLVLLASRNIRVGTAFRRGITFAALTGLCGAVGNYLVLRALDLGGAASLVFPLAGIFPLVTLALAVTFLRERPASVQVFGVFVSLVAIALLSGVESLNADALRQLAAPWMLYALGALMLFGLAGITQKVSTSCISAELSTVVFAVAFVPVALALVAFKPGLSWNLPPLDWVIGIGWGALNAVAMLVQLAAYASGPAATVTSVAALYPAITVLLAVALFREQLDAHKIVGIVLALIAGVALSREKPPAGQPSGAASSVGGSSL